MPLEANGASANGDGLGDYEVRAEGYGSLDEMARAVSGESCPPPWSRGQPASTLLTPLPPSPRATPSKVPLYSPTDGGKVAPDNSNYVPLHSQSRMEELYPIPFQNESVRNISTLTPGSSSPALAPCSCLAPRLCHDAAGQFSPLGPLRRGAELIFLRAQASLVEMRMDGPSAVVRYLPPEDHSEFLSDTSTGNLARFQSLRKSVL